MQLDSDVKPKSLAFNTFKDSAKNGCKAGPNEVIVRFVSDFTSSPIDTLIPAALGEAPTPCPSSESHLPTWYLLQILREEINGRKVPCATLQSRKWRHRAAKGWPLRMEGLTGDAQSLSPASTSPCVLVNTGGSVHLCLHMGIAGLSNSGCPSPRPPAQPPQGCMSPPHPAIFPTAQADVLGPASRDGSRLDLLLDVTSGVCQRHPLPLL